MNDYRLPVLQLSVKAYLTLFENISIYLRLIWFPGLVTSGSLLLLYSTAGNFSMSWRVLAAIGVVGFLMSILLFLSVITKWHRLIILGPGEKNSHIGGFFGLREWGYLWRSSAIWIMAVVIMAVVASFIIFPVIRVFEPGVRSFSDLAPLNPTMWVMLQLGVLPVSGLLLLLPAVAVGKPISFKAARTLCAGNWLRLWAIYLIAGAPEAILSHILYWAELAVPKATIAGELNVFAFANFLIIFVFFTITISVLSLAYKELVAQYEDHSQLLAETCPGDGQAISERHLTEHSDRRPP
jgi:hypothetical protein